MDRHHEKAERHCQSSEELLPSQMTVEQFDEMLSHMSRKQIRQAFKRMAEYQPTEQELAKYEIYDSKQQAGKESHNQHKAQSSDYPSASLPPARSSDYPPPPPPPPARSSDYPPPPPPPPAQSSDYPPAPPQPEPQFYGLNLGIVKLGVTDDGAINAGVNIGIAAVDTKFGLQNSVAARAGIGDFNAHTGAGVGLGRDGVHAHVYAGAKVFDAAHVDAGFGAGVGPRTGVDGRLSANAGPIRFKLDTDHEVGVNGLYSGVDARVGVPHAADFRTKAHVAVNQDSSAGADVGLELGHSSLGTGAGIETHGNTMLAPDVHIDASNRDNYYRTALGAQVGPGLDVGAGVSHSQDYNTGYRRHYNESAINVGVGESGIGVRQNTRYDDKYYRDWAAGVGRDFE
jgi:hypothetical protein